MTRLALVMLAACGGAAHPRTPDLPDDDHDGIPDRDDLCPVQPEDFDGDLDADGCPDADCDDCCATSALRTVQFYPGQIVIPPVEFPIVVAVANELRERPALRVLQLESWGPLGELRMIAVRAALLKLGIAPARLSIRSTPHIAPPPRNVLTGVGFAIEEGSCTTVVDPADEG